MLTSANLADSPASRHILNLLLHSNKSCGQIAQRSNHFEQTSGIMGVQRQISRVLPFRKGTSQASSITSKCKKQPQPWLPSSLTKRHIATVLWGYSKASQTLLPTSSGAGALLPVGTSTTTSLIWGSVLGYTQKC